MSKFPETSLESYRALTPEKLSGDYTTPKFWLNTSLSNLSYADEYGVTYIEEWKEIQGYQSHYLVSTFGRYKSLGRTIITKEGKSWICPTKILKQRMDRFGYLKIAIYDIKNIQHDLLSHRVLGKAFHPNPENKREINHKDGVKWNNFFKNLEWNTPSENQLHAFANKLQLPQIGEKNGMAKLTNSQVSDIFNSNENVGTLANKYNVRRTTIDRIKSGALWAKITGATYTPKQLSKEIVLSIFQSKESFRLISERYNVSQKVISLIKRGINYKDITNAKERKMYSSPTQEEKEKIRSCNLPIGEIAKMFNRSWNTINRIKNKVV